jgi:catechol 2,3-dioxygenase-like lactoylglutathione lyase family enzyme
MTRISKTTFVIAVPNLQSSAAFYRDILGFSIERLGDPGWLLYVSGACTIMAGECSDAIPPADLGDHSYFAYLQVDDIQSYYETVRASGAFIRKPLRDEPWGMREFGVATADGHQIMFAQPL